jgi:hypothetical protein
MIAVAFTHTSGWAAVIFPAGVRLSTWLMAGAFLVLAIVRRDGRFLGAMLAWLGGFEVAYQATAALVGNGSTGSGWPVVGLVLFGLAVTAVAWRRGVRPHRWLMLAVAVVWIAWLATGFSGNPATLTGLDVPAEVLNETAKTLWALAYLIPLLAPAGEARERGVARGPRTPSTIR